MKIFLNYRRDDSAGYAGRLFDHLTARFGAKNVFMDIDTIEPGEDFRKVVENAVGTCEVVLVMIGKQWLSMADAQGRRRLDNPHDWVRVEIASALANPRVRVIPVLVRDAEMPAAHELPDDLKELSWRNAIELSDTRFQHDANRLIEVIERVVDKPVEAPAGAGDKRSASRGWGMVFGIAALVLLIGLLGYSLIPLAALRTPTPTAAPTLLTATEENLSIAATIELTATESLKDPEAFVRNYFETLTGDRDYELAWSLLTPSFQNRNSPEGYDSYVSLWEDIESVRINRIEFYENTPTSARCDVNLTYYLVNGNTETYDVKYHLVFDDDRQTWLFESL